MPGKKPMKGKVSPGERRICLERKFLGNLPENKGKNPDFLNAQNLI